MKFPKAVQEAIDVFSKLPGIGRKTAQRLVQFQLKQPKSDLVQFGQVISTLKDEVVFCEDCFHITERGSIRCAVCDDTSRDRTQICIVEEFIDVFAIENTGEYRGLYHVLQGALSPIDGIGPGQLMIDALFQRVKDTEVKELILATNPTMEGEATALYIKQHLPSETINITRIAKGIPMGGDIDYADEVTLGNSMKQRVAY